MQWIVILFKIPGPFDEDGIYIKSLISENSFLFKRNVKNLYEILIEELTRKNKYLLKAKVLENIVHSEFKILKKWRRF